MLRGTLSDLAVADLVQLPQSAGRTGELVIATTDEDARLYYVQGTLVHLASGDQVGHAVLEEILGWAEGEFEFRQDVLTEETTFSGDLEQAIQAAVRARTRSNGDGALHQDDVPGILDGFIAENESALFACVILPSDDRETITPARAQRPDWLEATIASLAALMEAHPRPGLHRLFLEDGSGTIVASTISTSAVLLVAAKSGATLGAVSVAAERLTRTIRRALKSGGPDTATAG